MAGKGSKTPKPETFVMTDQMGLVHKGGKIFKAEKWHGPKVRMVEIDAAEYDARVQRLADTIMASPGVNLVDILKDALYDVPLKRLDTIEAMVSEEVKKAKTEKRTPDMKTTKRDRGTCINLAVGGKFCAVLRG